MDRKDFLKKGLLGTGMFVASASLASAMKNDIDEIEPLEPIGYNHLPNTESKIKENSVIHRADSRGKADHGWLLSQHTFSFANYYNPERMHFGVLRVLNDDKVESGRGFGTHPHDNMEIISIPLEGDLEHKDNMGNTAVIRSGDIQVMSAGTGIMHSEFNKNSDKLVKFLQIWIYPKKRNVTPRYDQITLDKTKGHNQFQQILSPNADDEGVWIHQDAWFHLGTFDQNTETLYQVRKKGNGIYAFILKGSAEIGGETIEERDGFGVWDIQEITIKALKEGTEILLMEVPMTL
ncbi:pirin family protein [Chryseobacterium viscerum]|uniref:Pirin family protein n=1 Tax=Chryseobacterium viscerum TaxID=1037377 RepID=A0A5N4BRY4_9FLAO|nr:pirin family protein [Chryseobacterium viscerum]KAB1230875.1 pirin family protein [Chryseobacterium viscerum]